MPSILEQFGGSQEQQPTESIIGQFGGGTPVVEQPAQRGRLIEKLAKRKRLKSLQEYTESLPKPTSVAGDIVRTAGRTIADIPTTAATVARGMVAFPYSGLRGLIAGQQEVSPLEQAQEYIKGGDEIVDGGKTGFGREWLKLKSGRVLRPKMVFDEQAAGEAMQETHEDTMSHIYRDEQLKTTEILFKPIEWTETATQFYGDMASEKFGDEAGLATKTLLDGFAYLYLMPKIAGFAKAKIKTALNAKSVAEYQQRLSELKGDLEKLQAEPKHLEILKQKELELQRQGENIGRPLDFPDTQYAKSGLPPQIETTVVPRPEPILPTGKPIEPVSKPLRTNQSALDYLNKIKEKQRQEGTSPLLDMVETQRTRDAQLTFAERQAQSNKESAIRRKESAKRNLELLRKEPERMKQQIKEEARLVEQESGKVGRPLDVPDTTMTKSKRPISADELIVETIMNRNNQSGFLDIGELAAIAKDVGRFAGKQLAKGKKGIGEFVKELEKIDRIVPDFKGGWEATKRQKPIISKTPLPEATKDIGGLAAIQSPHNVFHPVFGSKNNLVGLAFESMLAFNTNLRNAAKWKKHIFKKADIKNAKKDMKKVYRPWFEKHRETLEDYSSLVEAIEQTKRDIKKHGNTPRGKELSKNLKGYLAEKKILEAKTQKAFIEHRKTTLDLAKKHADVRIALHAEGELPNNIKLSPTELKVSQAIQKYMKEIGDALKAEGIPGLESGKKYMTHLIQEIANDPGAKGFFYRRGVPSVLRFQHRVPQSKNLFPSASTIMDAYIPIAEKKVAYQPLLNKVSLYARTTKNKNLGKYMEKWLDENLNSMDKTLWERGLNNLVTVEYIRLIGGSLSVARKHLFKLPDTLSQFDTLTNLRAINATAKVPVQMLMKKFGLKGEFAEAKAYRAFVSPRQITRMMDEVPGLDKMALDAVKRVAGQPTATVEAFDNGVSVMGSIISAMSKKKRRGRKSEAKVLTPEEATMGIHQSIFDNNFRMMWDQPMWHKKIGLRAATMFNMTPAKLLELKYQMIKRALNNERDVFGTHYGARAVKYLTYFGLAEAVARKNDTSILELMIHPPIIGHFLTTKDEAPYYGLQEPTVSQAPPFQWIGDMHKKGIVSGTVDHLSRGGTIEKIKRARVGDIPENYYDTDSPTKYVFGFQKIGAGTHKKKKSGNRRSRSGRSRIRRNRRR